MKTLPCKTGKETKVSWCSKEERVKWEGAMEGGWNAGKSEITIAPATKTDNIVQLLRQKVSAIF